MAKLQARAEDQPIPEPYPLLATEKLSTATPLFAREVVALFEAGLDRKNDICGYHGTSLEALHSLLGFGLLRNGQEVGKVTAGRLYFAAVQECFPGEQFSDHLADHPTHEAALKTAKTYAKLSAEIFSVIRDTGLDPCNSEHRDQVGKLLQGVGPDCDEAWQYMSRFGCPRDVISQALRNAESSAGVVLAIHKKISDLTLSVGEKGEGDLWVQPQVGLGIDYFCGIEPLDDRSYLYLEALQKQVVSGGKAELR